MSADYFLTDGRRVVPVEFEAWERASKLSYSLVMHALNCDGSPAQFERLERVSIVAKERADELERKARAAFWSALRGVQ